MPKECERNECSMHHLVKVPTTGSCCFGGGQCMQCCEPTPPPTFRPTPLPTLQHIGNHSIPRGMKLLKNPRGMKLLKTAALKETKNRIRVAWFLRGFGQGFLFFASLVAVVAMVKKYCPRCIEDIPGIPYASIVSIGSNTEGARVSAPRYSSTKSESATPSAPGYASVEIDNL